MLRMIIFVERYSIDHANAFKMITNSATSRIENEKTWLLQKGDCITASRIA